MTSPRNAALAATPGPPPPFDPECGAILAQLVDIISPSLTLDEIPELRATVAQMPAPGMEDLLRGGAFTVQDITVPGPPASPEISLLVCRPAAVSAPVAAIYYMHRGGMITGNNRSDVPGMLDIAEQLGLAVISVEYRLAPETPHPGPVEDCYAGLVWTVEHADELGIDASRIVVAGVSAGGGLAAAVSLMARDRGGPALFGQLLMCPMLDDRNDSVSTQQMAGLGVWDRTSNETGWTALLGSARGTADVSPYAAPARAMDLSRLPPTFIGVGSAETFRDENVAYASAIWGSGGVAELHVWPGGFHGYFLLAPQAQISRATAAAQVSWLHRLLG